jgi:hypothetical protein
MTLTSRPRLPVTRSLTYSSADSGVGAHESACLRMNGTRDPSQAIAATDEA